MKPGIDASRGLVKKIGSANVADKDKVTSEHEARLGGLSAIGDEKGEMLGGVPRRMNRTHGDVAEHDFVTILHAYRLIEVRAVCPVGPALV